MKSTRGFSMSMAALLTMSSATFGLKAFWLLALIASPSCGCCGQWQRLWLWLRLRLDWIGLDRVGLLAGWPSVWLAAGLSLHCAYVDIFYENTLNCWQMHKMVAPGRGGRRQYFLAYDILQWVDQVCCLALLFCRGHLESDQMANCRQSGTSLLLLLLWIYSCKESALVKCQNAPSKSLTAIKLTIYKHLTFYVTS